MSFKRELMFYNGRIIPAVNRLVPGRMRHPGVFETMLYEQDVVFFWERHLRRLRAGMRLLGFTRHHIRFWPIVRELVLANDVVQARVRLMVWREDKTIHTAVTVSPRKALSAAVYRRGFKVAIAKTRIDPAAHPASLKAIAYQPYARIWSRVQARGYDEALLLNQTGTIVEASRANIFFVKGDRLMTPECACGCLNGITRRIIMALALRSGLICRQVRLKMDSLFSMDEIFLTNSLIGVMPVGSMNGVQIGRPDRRPITCALQQVYRQFCQAYRRGYVKKL